MKNNYFFEDVIGTKDQTRYLYEELLARSHGISHKKTPSFDDHVCFVKKNPYRAWFILSKNDKRIGSIYIQDDNSVGLHISINEITFYDIYLLLIQKIEPLPKIKSKRAVKYFFNVAPGNVKMQEWLKNSGAYCTQMSFVIDE